MTGRTRFVIRHSSLSVHHPSMSVILITGGNGGLGIAIAKSFLDADAANQVWLGVRANRSKASVLAAQFSERCKLITLDVTSDADWKAAVDEIISIHQRLDVLINNAGHHHDALLAKMSDAQWHDVLQCNLTGAFHGCRAVVKTMMARKPVNAMNGRVTNPKFSNHTNSHGTWTSQAPESRLG